MSEENGSAILIRGARKRYKPIVGAPQRDAVRGVDISVAPGTIHGLLGPNGAGKTTTIKMLLGLVRPTAGEFTILGEDSTQPAGRRNVGFMPEQPYFPQHLRAAQALKLYAQLGGVPKDQIAARTSRLMERVGLQGREKTTLDAFSRGMLQRLGIAQALINEPTVVVLDEPASGLDPVGQRDIRNLMLELRDSGVTVLLSSHQLSEVEAVCDDVTIMNAGVVAAEGDLDMLLNVEGRTSIRARGLGDTLPASIASEATSVAASGGVWVFSVADGAVRRTVDAVDDAGGQVVSVAPVPESLEDYFARLLVSTSGEGDGR
ncbi:MAG: ABC transporter ATP-binding protein [Coriobacteriia bacterium]|nr:ABC transporter ATP-binding protein [Coriobacteriia bacterium]